MEKNKFQIKREETYRRLIEKGMEIFLQKGYAKTKIDDIAKAAGYTRGAFYFHFESKEDFFMHAMRGYNTTRVEWEKLPYQLDPEKLSLEEVLKASFTTLMNSMHGVGSGWIILFVDFYQHIKHDEKITSELKAIQRNFEDALIKFLDALQDRGFISSSINTREAALQTIMVTYGYMINYYVFDQKDLDLLIQGQMKILSGE
ncbi:MAG TPA: TetR/AcrR family transcriptional regulator [Bacillales bacterium]|nr:TetR/AcrR family transcriptional regulator [Bacillales bacterium]